MITYFRECTMPTSPDIKFNTHPINSSKVSNMAGIPPASRPLASGTSITDVNGSHSPQSILNGHSPSPPTLASLKNFSSQQLPPACGARQLSKLKRFLTTLQQFGSDISLEIGERVRTLVLGLVNSHLSIEEFHAKLQEATNFPLRPFVIPFLKANLPLLQRELLYCARLAKLSPQQFLSQNEHIMFNPTHSPLEMHESVISEINENGKRRSPDSRPKENALELHLESPTPAKRYHGNHFLSPGSNNRVSPGSAFSGTPGGPIRLEDISKSREMRERERHEREQVERDRSEIEKDRERHFSGYSCRTSEPFDPFERLDDDWRHVETMLNCIIGMVDKTKRAISVLQERSLRDREELSLWPHRPADGINSNVKKCGGDLMAFSLRQTDGRMSEVRRRAEEVVKDVRRQAMLELQRAVSVADQKAAGLVTAEKVKMERAIAEARTHVHTDLLQSLTLQEETSESCWNCGRKASETCSGCNMARYCGSFCQHKDWDNHHHICGKAHISSTTDAVGMRRAAGTTSTATTATTATSLALGIKVTESSSPKESPSVDPASNSCMSPTPSVGLCPSTKDIKLAIATAAAVTSTQRPSSTSSSPRTLSPDNSNPDIPAHDSESTVMVSSASETSAA